MCSCFPCRYEATVKAGGRATGGGAGVGSKVEGARDSVRARL